MAELTRKEFYELADQCRERALELAHYEWVELALSLDTREIRQDGINPDGDLLSGVPVLNELSWSLVYDYPVQRIGPDYRDLRHG